jgi:hypothetical protein
MAMPMRYADYLDVPPLDSAERSSEVREAWPLQEVPPSAIEFALHDAQNMLALLAANVEFLVRPDATTVDAVAGDMRESTRRLGQLLTLVATLLKQPE